MSEIVAGVCSIAARPFSGPPNRIEVIAIVSAAFGPDTTLPM